jgi:hypothetical protein
MPHPRYRGTTIELRTFSPSEKAEIDAWADKHGEPTSAFLLARIRDLMDAETHKKKPDLGHEAKLLADMSSLETELRQTKAILKKAEARLAFMPNEQGERFLNSRLIRILKDRGAALKESEIFSLMDATGDRPLEDLVREELERLEGFGLIRKSSHGYRWIR